MNVLQPNHAYPFHDQKALNQPQLAPHNSQLAAKNLVEISPVLITRFQLREMENMETSFRNQVHNVVALDQFIRKRLAQNNSGKNSIETALIGINLGDELSFRLPGSAEAFNIFTATLQRKSYFLNHRSRAEAETNLLKVNLKAADLSALEQELSIILENIKPLDYVFTVLQQRREVLKQKLAG